MKNTCECTQAYYDAEYNHFEPEHRCKSCLDNDAKWEAELAEHEAMIDMLQKWSGKEVKPLQRMVKVSVSHDDLPF